jgi:hypothetical protein
VPVESYVELWRAVATSVNVPEPFDHAQGGEAGMLVHLSDAPFEVRVAYGSITRCWVAEAAGKRWKAWCCRWGWRAGSRPRG